MRATYKPKEKNIVKLKKYLTKKEKNGKRNI
jgi:hypothetical protein